MVSSDQERTKAVTEFIELFNQQSAQQIEIQIPEHLSSSEALLAMMTAAMQSNLIINLLAFAQKEKEVRGARAENIFDDPIKYVATTLLQTIGNVNPPK